MKHEQNKVVLTQIFEFMKRFAFGTKEISTFFLPHVNGVNDRNSITYNCLTIKYDVYAVFVNSE